MQVRDEATAAHAHVSSAPAPEAPRGIRTYEEIEGGEGRVLSFRPHRYAAADLAPLRCTVAVLAAEATVECPLLDVSRNGVAFRGAALPGVEAGRTLPLSVKLDAYVLWSGRAEIRAVRGEGAERIVAASFGVRVLDGDELRLLREVWLPGVAGLRVEEQAWWRPAGASFRARVSELALYLAELEDRLRRLEATMPWHVAQGENSVARTALVARLREDVAGEVLRLLTAAGVALRDADPASAPADRAFAVRQLHGALMQVPWMHRARHKPLGYAGDFEVMNYLYERDFEGPTLFARTIGYAFMRAAAAQAVRCRKDLVKRMLRDVLERRAGVGRPVRLLSVAAGPARELQELLAELDELPADLEIVLFDQDKRALEHAFQRLRPLADARFPGRVRIEFLNESVRRLLRDLRLFEGVPPFDAVYSAGLFDYFREPTAVRLARNLCAAAGPGGVVLIGNMVPHVHRWVMDYLLDWDLLYRTREELAAIGARAAPHASVRVLEEASGVNPFVALVEG
ncbi:MAG TPA: class I SAM-dependent methyltransferase family protein [Anaeromyxobacter sp.]|nr:class I SAM-dependent methyltransferase family protein [Anaeromyxobacter sp.]